MPTSCVEAVKSEGRGGAGGSGWHATDDVAEAVAAALRRHTAMWDALGHGAAVTYTITVAPEASPRRTSLGDLPLPVAGV